MDPAPITSEQFRKACGRFPTGVTVTTTLGDDGTPHGITVSSFTSVSLDPPLVLVCIDLRSQMTEHLKMDRPFAINILGDHQQHLSVQFSKRLKDRFDNVPWYPGCNGVPLLSDVPAAFECRVTRMIDAGDHRMILGLVQHISFGAKRPLTYVNSAYQRAAQ